MPKRRVSFRSLRRVKKRLFQPSHVVGDSYLPSKYSSQGRKSKRRTFSQKVSRAMYPPFTYQTVTCNGFDHNTAGKQMVENLTLTNNTMISTLLTKLTDIYKTNNGVESNAIPSGFVGIDLAKNRGLKVRLKSFFHKFEFVNTCSATCELEMLFVKPARLIANADTTHSNAATWWQTCNNRTGLATNTENPIAISSDIAQTNVGDRPYKGATAAMFSKWYTIVKKQKFILQPGQLIKISHRQTIDSCIDYEDLEAYIQQPLYGLQVICIGKGQIVNGTTAGFADVTYSNFQLSFTYSRWMTAQLESYLRPVKMLTNYEPTAVAPANQTMYNPDSRTTVGYTENS